MNCKNSVYRCSMALAIGALTAMCAISAWAQRPRVPDPTNLLLNPGFETGDFTGWTVSGTGGNYGVNMDGFVIEGTDWPATVIVHSGIYAGYSWVDLSYYYLELSQTLSLEPGIIYDMGLWIGDGSQQGYGNSIYMAVDGVRVDCTTCPFQIEPGYQFEGGSFTASNPNPVVLFHIQGSGAGVAGFSFDDFSVAKDEFSFNTNKIFFPYDTFTKTLGINNKGLIAGYHGSGASGHPSQGFVLTLPKDFASENFPGSVQTQVVGIDNSGDTAGFYVDQDGINHGFLDISGTFSTVDFPGTTFNQLLGLNDANEAAGYWQDGNGTQFPYTYQSGIFTSLDSSLPTHISARATGVNNAGDVSGSYVDVSGVTHGFRLSGATLTTLDYPGATFTQALGLNSKGQVVGSYVDGAGATHGFVYVVISEEFRSFDDKYGIGTTVINGINDWGLTVGFFVDANGNTYGFRGHEYVTVPPNAVYK